MAINGYSRTDKNRYRFKNSIIANGTEIIDKYAGYPVCINEKLSSLF
jgi:hypothetical protein